MGRRRASPRRRPALTAVPRPGVTHPPGALARGSLARFAGEAGGAFFGLIVGAVTARALGPSGKGTLSALTYLVALAAPLCAVGLGEASQTLHGHGRATLARCVRGTSAVLVVTCAFGVVLLFGLVWTQFPGEIPGLRTAIVVASLTLPLITFVTVFGMLLDSAEQVVFVSLVRLLTAAVTAVATITLLYIFELAITGALVAIALGWSLGLALLLVRLIQLGLPFWPRWDAGFLRQAVPLGIPTQMSYLVIVASTRVDLLVVRLLAGPDEAGHYSIALTMGQLVTYAPVALSVAAFPLVARIGDRDEARVFVARLCRTTVAASLVSAAGLAAMVPILVPLAFGREFEPAVGPTLILLAGGVLWGAQWTACRSESARGRPGVLLRSFGITLVVMVVLDVVLIPDFGIVGAATASMLGSMIGLAVVVFTPRARDAITPTPRGLLPRFSDFTAVASGLAGIARRLRTTSEHPS